MISSEFDDVSPEIKDVIHRALPRFLLWRDESKLSERKIQSISEEFGEFVKKTSNWSHGNVALDLFALPRDIFEFDYDEKNEHWHLKEFPRFFAKTKEVLNIALCLTIYIIQKSIKLYTPAIRTKTPPNEPVKSEIYIKEYPEVFFNYKDEEIHSIRYCQEKFMLPLFNKLYLGFSFPKAHSSTHFKFIHPSLIFPTEAPISLCTLYLVHDLDLLYFTYIFRDTIFPINKTNPLTRFIGNDQIVIAGTCQDEAAKRCTPERQNLITQVKNDALPYTIQWKNSEWCIEFMEMPTESISCTENFIFKPNNLSYFEFSIVIHVKIFNEKLISCWAETSLGDTFFATWKSILKDVELVNYSNLKMRNAIIALANTAFMEHDSYFLNLDFVLCNFVKYKVLFQEYLELYKNKKNIEERELCENFLRIDEYKKAIVIEKNTTKMKCVNDTKKENFFQWYFCLEKTCLQARSHREEDMANHLLQPHKENIDSNICAADESTIKNCDSNINESLQIDNFSKHKPTNEEIFTAWESFLSERKEECREEKFYFQIVQYLLEKKHHNDIIQIFENETYNDNEFVKSIIYAKGSNKKEIMNSTKTKNLSNYIKIIRNFAQENNLPMLKEPRGRQSNNK